MPFPQVQWLFTSTPPAPSPGLGFPQMDLRASTPRPSHLSASARGAPDPPRPRRKCTGCVRSPATHAHFSPASWRAPSLCGQGRTHPGLRRTRKGLPCPRWPGSRPWRAWCWSNLRTSSWQRLCWGSGSGAAGTEQRTAIAAPERGGPPPLLVQVT